jgi:phosphohistidine phosphatase SixA
MRRWIGDVHLRLIGPPPSAAYRGHRADGRSASIFPLRRGPAGGEDCVHLTIVRHARAGNKRAWGGPDDVRPLDPFGSAQAAALAPRLAAAGTVGRLVSSPALRCVQTLQPLAGLVGAPIETWEALGPHADAGGLRATLGHPAFDDAVVCTHGELLRPLLRTLRRRGASRSGADAHGRHLLEKGSAWRLTIEPDGTVSAFVHLPAPT